MSHLSGIYSIESPSGNIYIGSSNNIQKRWRSHKQQLRNKIHPNRILQAAWEKYNANFSYNLLLVCEPENLLLYEQIYLDYFKPKYNICPIAGRPTNLVRSNEFKEKIRLSMMGNQRAKGNNPSTETRAKIGKASLGNKYASVNKGVPKSEEQKIRTSLSLMGHKVSDETRKKISETCRIKRELKNAI